MGRFHDRRFPNEDAEYRRKRDELLAAEIELRRQTERVAAERRALPPGGRVAEDYRFDAGEHTISLAELFAPGKHSLAIYSMMQAPQSAPCPSCCSVVDALDATAEHASQRINVVVVGKAPFSELDATAKARGWRRIRVLSSFANRYNRDYFAEDDDGAQWPVLNVFRRVQGNIFHSYATEMLFAPCDEGQECRHVDAIWPLWNLFDLTPEGRGTDWNPQFAYD